jgi:hypothetical protein
MPIEAKLKKLAQPAFFLLVWAVTIWLLYPLIVLDHVHAVNAKEYLYRAVIGISIMIILFGKTVFDLFFPLSTSTKITVLQTVFLTVYSMVLAGGIILMLGRLVSLFIRSQNIETQF